MGLKFEITKKEYNEIMYFGKRHLGVHVFKERSSELVVGSNVTFVLDENTEIKVAVTYIICSYNVMGISTKELLFDIL